MSDPVLAAEARARSGPLAGSTVLHYRIEHMLGEGGMGQVYRAEDTKLGRPVALKFIRDLAGATTDERDRLLREARAASSLKSSNIATVYDVAEDGDHLFIVMEHVEGEPVSAVIARGPLPLREALDIASQVADALDEAHGRGIVHRDIKSANLMIDAKGRVKVLDFGLAKFIAPPPADTDRTQIVGGGAPTMAGVVLGTVAYMAPEQALGRPIDSRADLFSLGVVLYEMLTGRLPFASDTPIATINQILNHQPVAVDALRSDVTPLVSRLVARALEKEQARRFQTAHDFYVDLRAARRALDGSEPKFTLHASQMFQLAAGLRRQPAQPAPQAAEIKSVAVLNFANISRKPEDAWIGTGIAETVASDLKTEKTLSVVGSAQVQAVSRSLGVVDDQAVSSDLALEVGRRARATWVIMGGFQRLGPNIRVTAQLVDVTTGHVTASVKLDGAIDELFSIQDQLVRSLTQELQVQARGVAREPDAQGDTRSLEAYEMYSKGLVNLRLATNQALDRAVGLFESATRIDPGYASAWSGLGRAKFRKGSSLGLPALRAESIENLRRAVTLAPRDATAQFSLGLALNDEGEVEEAVRAIRAALEVEPTNAGALSALGRTYWLGMGLLDEAADALERAVGADPNAGHALLQLAQVYALQGRYDRAEGTARRAVEMQERYLSGNEGLFIVGSHLRLGYVYYRLGRYDDAIVQYEKELAFIGATDHMLKARTSIEAHQKLASAYHRKGDTRHAERAFGLATERYAERERQGLADSATAYYIAALHGLWGHPDEAGRHLQKAFESLRASSTVRARLDPDFDPVRSAPAFLAVMNG